MAQLQPYCAIEGNDDGLPVVFVHGMGVDHRSLMMLDKAFDGNDSIRRIYLDLPGFGRTPALPEHACGLPEMADWLQTAIDGLVGKAAPFAMVGNSMGGFVVQKFLESRDIRRVRAKKKDKSGHAETWTVRYASGVPLSGDGDALAVNWIELAVTDLAGKETFRNAWITDIGITPDNAVDIAASGRARWVIENGNNNVLKTDERP